MTFIIPQLLSGYRNTIDFRYKATNLDQFMQVNAQNWLNLQRYFGK